MGSYRHASILVLFLLAACPAATSSVEHFVVLTAPPNIACVSSRLREISASNRIQSIRDRIPTGVNFRFNFEAENAPHSLAIFYGDDGSFAYRNTAWATNLTLAELRAAKQSLFEVDELLDGRCDLGHLLGHVQERCFGENCDLLSVTGN